MSFCLNFLCILLITKLYSILISEWIFWTKISIRKKRRNSMFNLRFLKYLWFLPDHTLPLSKGEWEREKKKEKKKELVGKVIINFQMCTFYMLWNWYRNIKELIIKPIRVNKVLFLTWNVNINNLGLLSKRIDHKEVIEYD